MFEIKIDDARYWKTIVNSIVSLIDEGTFKITKEGITLRATDAGGISMIIFNIPNKAFSKYNVDKNVSVETEPRQLREDTCERKGWRIPRDEGY